jgi:uncharacterized protein YndB with AHSA1/START domain
MQRNTLTITIKKPCSEVFAFTVDPKNTPRWIESIAEEVTNEWPPKVGTTYRNRGTTGPWTEYIITELETNKLMEMKASQGNYHVRYTYTPLDDQTSQLEYFEWVDAGELESPFTMATMEKLQALLEANHVA